ncbi:MAG: DUF3533 domain-containing protein [Slackia sp.]|nr:DUF3533 domain-containing protein [Slackia sp.]
MIVTKEAISRRAFAVPLIVGLVVFCVLGLAMAPMFRASLSGVPMAFVNLDEGVQLPTGGSFNAGDAIESAVTGSTSSDNAEASIVWTKLESREDLDAAMLRGDFYGALVIPSDFTNQAMEGQKAVAQVLQEGVSSFAAPSALSPEIAQAAQAQALQAMAADVMQAQKTAAKPTIDVVLNTAKNPMVAQNMQLAISAMCAQAGVQPNVASVGSADMGDSPLAPMMSVQFMVLPLFIMSLAMGGVFVALRWSRIHSSRAAKTREIGIQVAYCAVASLIAATIAYGMVSLIGGIEIGVQALLLLWLASFCLMVAMTGLCDIAMPLGVIVMVVVFALGMGTAVLPDAMLPDFWADMVLPWAPQFCIGEGLRGIIYLGEGAFDAGVAPLLAWAFVGVAAYAVAIALPPRAEEGSASVSE